MLYSDYHTHSSFSSDSDTPIEENIKKAVSLGIKEIAATDHIDFDYPDPDFPFLFDYEPYSKEIDRLRKIYDIKILKGVEIGVQPHVIEQINSLLNKNEYDFIIASSHVLKDKYDICKNDFFEGKTQNEAYFEYFDEVLHNVENYDFFNVYGHIDFINRYGTYKNKVINYIEFSSIIDKILKTIIQKNKGIEINTSGYRYGLNSPHPCFEILKRYYDLGGKIITVGSDAHKPEHIAYKFKYIYTMLKEIGFEGITTFNNRKPNLVKLF